MQHWFPYFSGLGFYLVDGNDTILASVPAHVSVETNYWAGDECPPVRGTGFSGSVVFGAGDTLLYRTGESPDEWRLSLRGNLFSISGSGLGTFNTSGSWTYALPDSLRIGDTTYPRTVVATAIDTGMVSRVFITHGIGVTGIVSRNRTFVLTPPE